MSNRKCLQAQNEGGWRVIEKKKKSVLPVYGVAAVFVLYCLIFPLYRTGHFIALAFSAILAYFILSAIFPGKTEYIEIPEEPERTGDEKINALLEEGEKAVSEMHRLRGAIPGEAVKKKIGDIAAVTDKIFKDLLEDPDDYKRVKRFADFYLPTTIKLLNTYDRLGKSGAPGENVSGTLERIDTALDTILDSYEKFFDSLFENQALDIETDIHVLETILKQEGLTKF
jgi:5-bromo-4-chloroindolyl phosphate hydrolysis protein